jgi:hypothetical protein
VGREVLKFSSFVRDPAGSPELVDRTMMNFIITSSPRYSITWPASERKRATEQIVTGIGT